MPNKLKGEVALTLTDGRCLTLVMDMEALIQAEDAADLPMDQLLSKARRGFIGAQRALLFGALRTHHKQMTMADAADILSSDGAIAFGALADAMLAAFGPAEGKEDANPPSPPVGTNSGLNGAKRGSTRKSSGEQRPALTA